MSTFRSLLLALSIFCGAATSAQAAVVEQFAFYDAQNAVVADGYFSFDPVHVGIISYADLQSFSISFASPNEQTYNLGFVNSLASTSSSAFIYFGFDVQSNQFVPASIKGYSAPGQPNVYSGILAATDGFFGFFIDPLAFQSDPAGTGNDGAVVGYFPAVNLFAEAYNIAAIPELPTWAMLMMGFGFLVMLARFFQNVRPKAVFSVETN